MSALSVEVPFPVFYDRAGEPLENGYVFIGQANLNPQTNPIQVYFDRNLTQPAAQPLRTLAGYISNAGTPAQVYIDGVDFSIQVQDKNGTMVYNFPDGTGISPDACGITYDPPFTGAVPTPVCVKLAETVSVRDFGATSGADTAAINAAITYAISSGKRVQFPFAATIRVPEDAPNLQAAFDAIYPEPNVGFLLTVRISAGYEISDGLLIENGDFGNIEITSQDATVNAASSFNGLNGGDVFCTNSLLVVRDAVAPRWRILVDMLNRGGGLTYTRSQGFIGIGKGIIDSSEFGIYLRESDRVYAAQAVFKESAYGNRVTLNGMFNAPQANFSDSKQEFYVGTGRTANLDVSRGSVAYISGTPALPTNLTGGAGRGLAVRRSFVSATNVDCSSVARDGLNADLGAVVAFSNSIASNCGLNGVFSAGSWVAFNESGVAVDNANFNLFANNGGRIMARGATLTGGGVQGVRAAQGSEIIIPSANCRRNGVSDQSTDIFSSEGSYISAFNALGGTNFSPLTQNTSGLIVKATDIVAVRPLGAGNVNSLIDLDFPDVTSTNATVRVFRSTNTSGVKQFIIHAGDGTATAAVTATSTGNLTITGALSKGSGSFKIDHPLKPETHHLVHSFIEGPQADNIYRGTAAMQAGKATVNLDDAARMTQGTFAALNCNVQCYTTNESGWSAVRGKVAGNVLTIEAQDAESSDNVSWMVIGERCDQHMKDTDWTDADGRVITEPAKVEVDYGED